MTDASANPETTPHTTRYRGAKIVLLYIVAGAVMVGAVGAGLEIYDSFTRKPGGWVIIQPPAITIAATAAGIAAGLVSGIAVALATLLRAPGWGAVVLSVLVAPGGLALYEAVRRPETFLEHEFLIALGLLALTGLLTALIGRRLGLLPKGSVR